MGFIADTNGRVPFAVLGVFLIVGSAVTSGIVTNLEAERSKELGESIPSAREKYILRYVEADLARAIDAAARRAFKEVGRTPVYNGSDCAVDSLNSIDNIHPEIPSRDEPDTVVNLNRVRYATLKQLKEYILANYCDGQYTVGNYAVNVTAVTNTEPARVNPLYRLDDVGVEIIKMKLRGRNGHPLAPVKSNLLQETYPTYARLSVPVEFQIRNMSTGKAVLEKESEVGSLVSSRYLLLETITHDFEENIQGTTSALGIEALASIMALTWIRGYVQWATSFAGITKPSNIISNQWLAIATTGGLLLEEGFVFNASDPAGPLYIAYEILDAISYDITGVHIGHTLADLLGENGKFVIPHEYIPGLEKDISLQSIDGLGDLTGTMEKFLGNLKDGVLGGKDAKDWSSHEQTCSIGQLADDKLASVMSNNVSKRIKEVYRADMHILTAERNNTKDNRQEIEQEVDDLQTEDEDSAKADMESEAEGDALDSVDYEGEHITSVNFIRSWTPASSENKDEHDWSLILEDTERLKKTGYFDNDNLNSVTVGGEKWKVNKTRKIDYSWETKSKWKITVENETKTHTWRGTVNDSHSTTKTEWYNEEVVIKFKSDKYAYGRDGSDIGENDIVDPFDKNLGVEIFQDKASNEYFDDANLNWTLRNYRNSIDWPGCKLNMPLSEQSGAPSSNQKMLLEGNQEQYNEGQTSHRKPIVTPVSGYYKLYQQELISIISKTLENLKKKITDGRFDVTREMGPDQADEMSDPAGYISDIAKEMKNKFEENMTELKNQSEYRTDGKYLSAAAKTIYLLRHDYVGAIYRALKEMQEDAEGKIRGSYEEASDKHQEEADTGTEATAAGQTYDGTKTKTERAQELQGQQFKTKSGLMTLQKRDGETVGWEEPVAFAINQTPHFFSNRSYNKIEGSSTLEKSGENLQEVHLSYCNINIFSPLQGIIDSLMDLGFDALNDQVFSAIDQGFAALSESDWIQELEESGELTREQANDLNTYMQNEWEDDLEAAREDLVNSIAKGEGPDSGEIEGIIGNLTDKIYDKVDNEWLIFRDPLLSREEIEDAVKDAVLVEDEPKETLRRLKNEKVEDVDGDDEKENTKEIIIYNLGQKLEEKYQGSELEAAKDRMKAAVNGVFQKAVSKGLENAKDTVKETFTQLSDALSETASDKINDVIQDKLEETVLGKVKQKIKSVCGGIIPAGLPLLPPFGWWATFNAWGIDVRGDIPRFEIADTQNYPGQHALYGHEAQNYVRKFDWIWEDVDGDTFTERLGKNTPVEFNYTTGSFIVVPGGGTGVGDRTGGFIERSEYP